MTLRFVSNLVTAAAGMLREGSDAHWPLLHREHYLDSSVAGSFIRGTLQNEWLIRRGEPAPFDLIQLAKRLGTFVPKSGM